MRLLSTDTLTDFALFVQNACLQRLDRHTVHQSPFSMWHFHLFNYFKYSVIGSLSHCVPCHHSACKSSPFPSSHVSVPAFLLGSGVVAVSQKGAWCPEFVWQVQCLTKKKKREAVKCSPVRSNRQPVDLLQSAGTSPWTGDSLALYHSAEREWERKWWSLE